MIPFSPPYIDDDIIKEVADTLQSGWITTGPKTKLLEEEIAAYCTVEKALAVNSATSAMMLVLHWFGITRGDEVIVPAYTYCATALAAMHIGAKPVMVDVGDDFNIDPEKIKAAITAKTKAIITVDFGGWPCDYEKIYALLKSADVKSKFTASNEKQQQLGRIMIMSDAAHALGAVYNNLPVGKCADITIFSLHAVKNVTSAEGGVIAFNMPAPFSNEAIYSTMRLWSLNGQTKDAFTKSAAGGWEYDIVYPGFKMNMPDVLAAMGLAQFRAYKKNLLAERKRVFDFYNEAFALHEWAILPPFKKTGSGSSYHLYPLRIKDINEEKRNAVIERIAAKGVAVNVHFKPLPMLTIFKEAGYRMADYPAAYKMYCNEISLPVYPQLNNDTCKIVADAVCKAVDAVALK
ncbi:DegT/DnrJ/EryC1/StrS family aminotransferase [Panacibacter ginsenosidivorans]|uniref:DegT/DnrJ/EryC1/StrS family aminotransferase n=1 Tax=Panacibacter ginsenosidivorans TaxID=1813871 RepID=A0A5B8VDP9_9BACT|nr:DegT/DnrJ/EryC1/StrS family aminotransferase [Panacibacter ginsenosidivorans]QEC69101.1 DegT/DnrJ/EryC1/StrS family aminotransferase [Panacibacter ginsenosidivorans]